MKRRPEDRISLLGGKMDLLKPAEVFHFVHERLIAGRKTIIANHNLHSLYLIRKDPAIDAFFRRAHLIEVDSIPLIFWARLVGRASRRFHRCTYLDWREGFWARAAVHRWRVFFVGGAEGVGEQARARILQRWPGVNLGVHHGYFDAASGSPENEAVLAAVNAFAPDILFVGMGMPRQETWILRNYERLPACVMFTVGGAFDYEAGVQTACPRWIGRLGLEWLFRLCLNPRRLFRRYCVEPAHLLEPAARDLGRAFDPGPPAIAEGGPELS